MLFPDGKLELPDDVHFFIIKALTNLHAGSGERSFSVVDNMVQRDEVTKMPIIQASSLKGAIRDFADTAQAVAGSGEAVDASVLQLIFGASGDEDHAKAGEFRFFQAGLLALPVRSGHRPYYLATTREIVGDTLEFAGMLGVELDIEVPKAPMEDNRAYITDDQTDGLVVEDFPCAQMAGLDKLERFFNYEHIALFTDRTFKSFTSVLPVIARNKIGKDGTSENLFYEEVLPRQSLLGFFISIPARIELVFRVVSDLRLPDHKGSTFRGVLKTALKQAFCAFPRTRCHACYLAAGCPSGIITDHRTETGENTVLPYALSCADLKRNTFSAGDQLSFDIFLAGKAISLFPYIAFSLSADTRIITPGGFIWTVSPGP